MRSPSGQTGGTAADASQIPGTNADFLGFEFEQVSCANNRPDPISGARIGRCSICDGPRAHVYKLTGTGERMICVDCFETRCVECGALCVNGRGELLQGVSVDVLSALYCDSCLPEQEET